MIHQSAPSRTQRPFPKLVGRDAGRLLEAGRNGIGAAGRHIAVCTALALSVLALAAPAAEALPNAASPWDGTWLLDARRSSEGASGGAATAYRFRIRGRSIRWEIPALAEVVEGTIDGRPMTIRRGGRDHGMTLGVVADGPATLRYTVRKAGRYFGGGTMTLVDDGGAWVDITWGPPGPPHAAELVYVKSAPHAPGR